MARSAHQTHRISATHAALICTVTLRPRREIATRGASSVKGLANIVGSQSALLDGQPQPSRKNTPTHQLICLTDTHTPREKSTEISKYLRIRDIETSHGSWPLGSSDWLHNLYHAVLKGLPFETILLNGRMRPKNVLKD